MSGGSFTLTGGFWAPVAVQTAGAPTLSITPANPGQATQTWSPDGPGFILAGQRRPGARSLDQRPQWHQPARHDPNHRPNAVLSTGEPLIPKVS
jgi:hypothetical protein